MASVATERNLLFGLLALQNGLIDQSKLVATFHAWTVDKARMLADLFVERGDLNTVQRNLLEALAEEHVEKNGGSIEKSLAAIPAGRSARAILTSIGDSDVEASVTLVGTDQTGSGSFDLDYTAGHPLSSAKSDGQRFRVLRPHAQGGLGAVFVALDNELHREVALKEILERHADDPVSRQRFLVEAQVTGGLEHPGIVPVYSLGSYSDGRPFYAMRFIQGESLKEAVDRFHADEESKHDPGRRSIELLKLLRRFLDVCNAIGYAHSRGILHRDIKPSNIIVGRHGETLVVDWGLAKVMGKTEATASEQTLVPSSCSGSVETLPGSAPGTPAYMSPEQAEGDLEAVEPRSDVYCLGATLYCLLTGRPPFAGDHVGPLLDKVKCGDFAPPRHVDSSIDPALEAVCLKAMATKPENRYGTARALAEDIERWMADEPVTAWQEPMSRCAGRWARRNRTAVVAATVALFAGVLGLTGVAGVQAQANGKLRKANAATTTALLDTKKAQSETTLALKQSEESRTQAEAVSAFLVEAFRSPDPSQDGRNVKLADVLTRAADRLDKKFTGSQVTKGKLLSTLGETYYGLGLYEKSVNLFVKSAEVLDAMLGPNHSDTLASRNNLAVAYQDAGRLPEAIALLQSTLKQLEAGMGRNDTQTVQARMNLGSAYWAAGRLGEAIALFEEVVEQHATKLGFDSPEAVAARINLANAYRHAGRTQAAIGLDRPVLEQNEATLGEDHPTTLVTRNNLAMDYQDAGRWADAIALHESVVVLQESKLGLEHPTTLLTRNNLAQDYQLAGRWADSERMRRETLVRRRRSVKPDSLLLAGDLLALGGLLAAQSYWSEAEILLRESLGIFEKTAPGSPKRYLAMSLLGQAILGEGRYAEAEKLIVPGYEGFQACAARLPFRDRPAVLEAAERVVHLYEGWGTLEQCNAWKAKLGMPDLPSDVFSSLRQN